jgi:hypothetical protein
MTKNSTIVRHYFVAADMSLNFPHANDAFYCYIFTLLPVAGFEYAMLGVRFECNLNVLPRHNLMIAVKFQIKLQHHFCVFLVITFIDKKFRFPLLN